MSERLGKVLIAEDELGPRESLRMILKEDYEVACAHNGEEAVAYVAENDDVDVVLLDIKMPKKDGIEVLREIRNLRSDAEVLILTGYGSLDTAVKAMKYGAYDYLTKPYEPKKIPEYVQKGVERRRAVREARKRIEHLEKITSDLRSHYVDTAHALVRSINDRDGYDCFSTLRVATVAGAVAEALGYEAHHVETLRHVAVLRDLGKIGVDETVLQKHEPLDEEERKKVESHPGLSALLLRSVYFMQEFLPYIEHHHERYDGTGYPRGLARGDIPREASVIAFADAYGAMAAIRPYREAMTHDRIVEEVKASAGTQFDPQVVEAFFQVEDLPERLESVRVRAERIGCEEVLREILLSGPGKEAGEEEAL
jgi:putative two-component system response regulator